MCCALKPICSWHLEHLVAVCRERCGGQGYLSCNRFGTFIGLAHAAMTAEGDNSVLIQKVSDLNRSPRRYIKLAYFVSQFSVYLTTNSIRIEISQFD